MNHKFPKSEHLTNKKIIKELFEKSSSIFLYPFKLAYLTQIKNYPEQQKIPPQILFVVPKRSFKKAVDRNKIRRRMKECYRLNKTSFSFENEQHAVYALSIIYVAKEILNFDILQEKTIKLFEKLTINPQSA